MTFQNGVKYLKNKRGITLIEILVVLAIIALLATVVTTRVTGYLAKAKVDTAKTQIKTFTQALELYRADNDYYPTTDQGLAALISVPTVGNVPENYPAGGYIKQKQIPKDPWNNDYAYVCEDGEVYAIISYGKDKKEGGAGDAADISSDDL